MIKLHNLTKEFGPQVAVKNINLDIPAGQLVGLLRYAPDPAGRNGAPKMLADVPSRPQVTASTVMECTLMFTTEP